MKNYIKLFIAISLVSLIVIFAGCSSGNNGSQQASDSIPKTSKQIETTTKPTEVQTEKVTEKPTEKPTDPPTEKPTEPPTEVPKPKMYTAEELLSKSISEILDLLDYDITVDLRGYGGSSTASICFYNFDKLHGFVFSPQGLIYSPDETDLNDVKNDILSGDFETLSFIAVIDNGNVNDMFSADMTYNDISGITGNYSTQPPAGQGLIKQDLTAFCNSCSHATVTYETSSEAMKHMDSKTGYDPEFLKQENPKVDNITVYPN